MANNNSPLSEKFWEKNVKRNLTSFKSPVVTRRVINCNSAMRHRGLSLNCLLKCPRVENDPSTEAVLYMEKMPMHGLKLFHDGGTVQDWTQGVMHNQNDSKQTEDIEKEIKVLQSKMENVDREIDTLQQEGYEEQELKEHMEFLHKYNEIKDVGQMILGRIASQQGVTTRDLYEQYGLNLDD